MSNHPNRTWRRTMHAAADDHLSGYRWPDGGGSHVMSSEELREALRTAYLAGYSDGRLSAMQIMRRSNESR